MHTHKDLAEICMLVQSLDVKNEDAIVQAVKMRNINEKMKSHVKDEKQLSELFDTLNAKALQEGENSILAFVTVITSSQCAAFSVNGKTLRHGMLSLLQKNYQNSDNLKREDLQKLYNSFELLGQYYNKARLQNGSPVSIIGQSLLSLINVELEKELRQPKVSHFKNDDKFARMILSQITLNGRLFKNRQQKDIETCMFSIRKCLIEIPSLSAKTKAFLIASLDLYYNNFANLGRNLERFYQNFLIEDNSTTSVDKAGTLRSTNGKQEHGKLEKTSMTKAKQPNLKLHIKKSDASDPMRKSFPTPSHRSSPASTPSAANFKNPRRDFSAPPARPASSRQKAVSNPPQKTTQQNNNASRSPRPVSASPQFRSYSVPSKVSPQEIRNRKSHPSGLERDEKHAERFISNRSAQNNRIPDASQNISQINVNDENILRPQNSRSSTPSSSMQNTPKHRVNSKVYFREENVENLTWNGESAIDGDSEDPDASTSPKLNPYSSSFLNFLSSN